MSEAAMLDHPDHDLDARRAAAWARHHAQVARIAAAARASAAVEMERQRSRHVDCAMREAWGDDGHDLIDRAAVAWRRARAGDAAAAADLLERALDDVFPTWRLVCPG